MNIGFIKLGLKTYFKKSGTGQGSNHELVDLFDIFEKRGHNCFMISGSDKYQKLEDTSKLDYIFVFNGPNTKYNIEKSTVMLMNYTLPYLNIVNNTDTPYAYFWTDPRKEYNPFDNPNFKRKPNIVFSQESENYGHLEKLILYGKKFSAGYVGLNEKEIKLGIVMNDTNEKRSKDVLQTLKWIGDGEIKGVWKNKNEFLNGSLKEEDVDKYLSKVKYSYNLATNSYWVSQKYYEMILNNVVCFYKNYDNNELILTKEDFRRVKDEIDLEDKIALLENNKEIYLDIIKTQQQELREDYFNGDFVYNFIINKIKQEVQNEMDISNH